MAEAYYEAFEDFVRRMTQLEDTTVPLLEGAADRLCSCLRIAKLEVSLFRDRRYEELGRGNTLVFYESSLPYGDKPLESRKITQNYYVVIFRVLPVKGEAPWTEEEQQRIYLMLDTLYVFNGRTRLLEIADRFTYFDDDGYHNLRFYIRYAEQLNEEGKLERMTAMHFNLKHFSLVNQQIGRNAGSFVMLGFIEGLQRMLGECGWVCRIGGDNFAVLAEKIYTQPILDYLSGMAIVYDVNHGSRIRVSASVGVFDIPEGFEMHSASDIMDRIISASQAARSSSTTDVVFFDESMIEIRKNVLEIQRYFPTALERGEFLVYYQPKININGKELAGAEALCRWLHNGVLIAPADFIPALESGMEICKLDFHVLDTVCRDIRRWLDEGRDVVRISVNLSRRHMADPDLLEHILEIVDRNNVPHEYIEIELTETTTDVEFTDLKRVVRGLQNVGIYTSVDDFGMGYSSLNLIKEIPWDVLKVDKSFLPDDDDDDKSRRSVMFRYVVAMARAMGLECIAEGVETESQVGLLRENNCDLAQGFFFDRPLPLAEFEKRLQRHTYPDQDEPPA